MYAREGPVFMYGIVLPTDISPIYIQGLQKKEWNYEDITRQVSLSPIRGIKTYYLWQPVSQWELKRKHKALRAAEGGGRKKRERMKEKGS